MGEAASGDLRRMVKEALVKEHTAALGAVSEWQGAVTK